MATNERIEHFTTLAFKAREYFRERTSANDRIKNDAEVIKFIVDATVWHERPVSDLNSFVQFAMASYALELMTSAFDEASRAEV